MVVERGGIVTEVPRDEVVIVTHYPVPELSQSLTTQH